MLRMISPPRDQLEKLRPPLTVGERQVLDLFDARLDPAWEIYVQPHLNGLRPDLVLVHPRIGIGVFEVKDWDLDALPYETRYRRDGSPTLWATNADGVAFLVKDNPVEKIVEYREHLLHLYCPRLGRRAMENSRVQAVVTAGVIMTRATTEAAAVLLQPFREFHKLLDSRERYYPLVGGDALDRGDIAAVFPEHDRSQSFFMEEQFALDLKTWLIEPDHQASQRQPLPLSRQQMQLADSRPPRGYRKIKGPAGTGKSLVLAARAATLALAGQDVLVVTFNITLWHYLRDLAKRHPDPALARTTTITWRHFHEWCKDVCFAAGMQEEYHALWRGLELDDDEDDLAAQDNPRRTRILEHELPALAAAGLQTGSADILHYDAILVDEGQDFRLDWWNLLRQVRRDGGEMVLVADETQDLYQRAKAWTDDVLRGSGFSGGPWIELKTSYRLPSALLPYIRRYADDHLRDFRVNLPEPPALELPDINPPLRMRWVQVEREDAANATVEAVLAMPGFADPTSIAFSDITLLVDSHGLGMRCVRLLKQQGIDVAHVFATKSRAQRLLKRAFFMGDARVKATTIHSFKGWEARALVICVRHARTPRARAGFYVALSRLKEHGLGSFLTVVCSAPDLEAFGETWPEFERRAPVWVPGDDNDWLTEIADED
jgi:hypothetical protein